MDIETANTLDRAAFVRTFGGVFEHSPWVAERAFGAHPFASFAQLHEAMVAAVLAAPRDKQIALLRAHPDLAGKEARSGTMTDSSVVEQASAGLDHLAKAEVALLAERNAAYRGKHGFPFIIAVRHYTKEGILHEFARRLDRDTEAELATNLEQISAITRMRLAALFAAREGEAASRSAAAAVAP